MRHYMNGEWMTNWAHSIPLLLLTVLVVAGFVWFFYVSIRSNKKDRPKRIATAVALLAFVLAYGLLTRSCGHGLEEHHRRHGHDNASSANEAEQ